MNVVGEDEIHARRSRDAHERQQVRCGNDSALVFVRAACAGSAHSPAPQRIPPRIPARPAAPQSQAFHAAKSPAQPGAGHADRAQRNQPVLDLVVADQSGSHAADADAHRQHRVQVAGLGLPDVQHIRPVDHDRRKQQRTKEPEVGIAQHRQKQRAVACASSRSAATDRRRCSAGMVFRGAAAGTLSMPRLVANPIADEPSST